MPWPFYHSHLVMAGGGGRKSGRKGEGEEGRIHFNLSLAPVTCSVGTVSPHCHQTLRFPFVLRGTAPPPPVLGVPSWISLVTRVGTACGGGAARVQDYKGGSGRRLSSQPHRRHNRYGPARARGPASRRLAAEVPAVPAAAPAAAVMAIARGRPGTAQTATFPPGVPTRRSRTTRSLPGPVEPAARQPEPRGLELRTQPRHDYPDTHSRR